MICCIPCYFSLYIVLYVYVFFCICFYCIHCVLVVINMIVEYLLSIVLFSKSEFYSSHMTGAESHYGITL
ncbi:unnamed protein product [Meloidogyne enterolobii]|uniref:Uncharacterized protein n=1 Tax=Meloidogyne enterolobii TaxID=390850 RepID=A0ACB0Y3R5_MELEN